MVTKLYDKIMVNNFIASNLKVSGSSYALCVESKLSLACLSGRHWCSDDTGHAVGQAVVQEVLQWSLDKTQLRTDERRAVGRRH